MSAEKLKASIEGTMIMNATSTMFAAGEDETPSLVSEPPASLADIAFIRCVERLEEMIEAETRILRACAPVDFEALNQRKTHALLEFRRVARNSPPKASEAARRRLARLCERLAVNTQILGQHLQAMQEITDLIVDSIRKGDSDGTYSMNSAARR